MTKTNRILIKNIYYMLSYAFQTLRSTNYRELESESFEHIHDLLAEILIKGISQQLKRGLYRVYVPFHEDLPTVRGKINIQDSIQNKLRNRKVLSCEFEDLSLNNRYNQILKTTLSILLKQENVHQERKIAIKRLLMHMGSIDTVNPYNLRRDMFKFHRNNQSYLMLLQICYFVLDGLLLSEEKGKHKLADYFDEQRMSSLFERFVSAYYQKHHPQLFAGAAQVRWAIDDDFSEGLPAMITDVTLKKDEKFLIIDTKFYYRTMQYREKYNSRSIHSANLYQMFAYVKNKSQQTTGSVSGLILYAKTTETITPDYSYMLSGNKIRVETLDLNVEFPEIAMQLDNIALNYF